MAKESIELHMAEDGVQEAPMADARAVLTRLVDDASIDGTVSAFTTRRRRRAYVIPPAMYDELLKLRAEAGKK